MKNKVSIIVPVYNNESYLDRCIKSICDQTYKNLEIILVNDGSTDSSGKICDKYVAIDNRIKVFHNKNNGVSYSRNFGMKKATGEYIFFCDSDDYLDCDVIEKLIDISKEKSLAKVNFKRIYNEKHCEICKFNSISSSDFINKIMNGQEDGYCWGYLFKKETIDTLCFDTNSSYLEDLDFLLNYLVRVKYLNFVDSETYYNYIDNSNGISSAKTNILKKISDIQYSLSKISELLKKNHFNNVDYCIDKKRISLINYLTQNATFKQMNSIFDDKEIISLCNRLKNQKVNIKNKVFIHVILSRNYVLFVIYKLIRKCLKRVKSWWYYAKNKFF